MIQKQKQNDSSSGKIKEDFFYYDKLLKSLSRIYPSTKYEKELVQICISLQELYEKITAELKSNKFNSGEEFQC